VKIADTLPLPTSLAGTTVMVKDSAGRERLSPLFFVAPAQVNFQIPPGTASGNATITVTSGNRAQFLDKIKQAYQRRADLPNLLLDLDFKAWALEAQPRWRLVVTTAQSLGVPAPAMSASLAYFDSYRTADLPQNLTQAQRDFFGSHTYERTDKPELGFVHTEWEDLAKQ
jgi:hypothetical protein